MFASLLLIGSAGRRHVAILKNDVTVSASGLVLKRTRWAKDTWSVSERVRILPKGTYVTCLGGCIFKTLSRRTLCAVELIGWCSNNCVHMEEKVQQ